jgi:hypothetical protein
MADPKGAKPDVGGLDADLKAKADAKFDPELEKEVCEWIEKVTGRKKEGNTTAEWLHDGQVLCALVNAIRPETIKKVNTSSLAFKQMENITYFTAACRDFGVAEFCMFGTPDLYEEKNMGTVINAIYTFGGAVQDHCPEYAGPKLGHAGESRMAAKDQKRQGGVATQSGGFTGVMEVHKASTDARGITTGSEAGTKRNSLTAGGGYTGPKRNSLTVGRGYAGSSRGASPAVSPAVSPRPPASSDVADAAGLDSDLAAAQAARLESLGPLAKEVCDWIEAITGDKMGEMTMHEWLKSGVVLCNLANKIKPGAVNKINQQSMAFKQMENITNFMNFARGIGVPESSMFGTPDLYEEKNMGSVIKAINSFGGAVQAAFPDFSGPKLGLELRANSKDKRRVGIEATSQSEGMNRCMDIGKPKDGGIVMGAS